MKNKFIPLLLLAIVPFVTPAPFLMAQATGSTTMTVRSAHTAGLSWTASVSSGVTGYNIFRSTVSGGPYTKINFTLIAGTSYTDATAVSGQFYCYVTTAYAPGDDYPESSYSAESCLTLP